MQNNFTLTENGINSLLTTSQINIEINIDIYLQLIQYKILSEKHNLFQCTLKDDTNTYDKFILKSKKDLNINNIIHIIKIKITIAGEKRYINCLIYENLEINDYVNRLNEQKKIQEKKEKEQKQQEELIKKQIEEEELKKKRIEELKESFLNEELNKDTKLIISNLKHETRKQRYNFKWEKGNLKYIDLKEKLNENSNIIEEEKNNDILDLDKSDDKGEIKDKDKEIININQDESENKEAEVINEIEDKNKEIKETDENEDKKEVEDIFKGINLEDLFKINVTFLN
jgi:hypothetical protein